MYHPPDRPDRLNPEFIELYNSNPWPEDISGFLLTGDIGFYFPPGTVLAPESFVVVTSDRTAFATAYGVFLTNAWSNSELGNEDGTVRLRNRAGDTLLEVNYGSKPPWPSLADGKGYSLVLTRPSFGEADPRAWAPSRVGGGSPGRLEPPAPDPLRAVVINEIFASAERPQLDFIELYNRGSTELDISGCSLSDSPTVNKFVFAGTFIQPGSYVALDEFGLGFAFKSGGDTIYFRGPTGALLDVVKYGPQAIGISLGRVPEGGDDWFPLSPPTDFAPNTTLFSDEIVINEIMYAPVSGDSNDEYLELHNRSTNHVNVGGWRFTDGIEFTIRDGTILTPNGYLVIARSLTNLLSKYANLSADHVVGNYNGSLADKGERVVLARPQTVVDGLETNTVYVVADEVTYGAGGRWGQWSQGGGSSLELIDARAENRLAANWADSDESGKSSWTTIEITGALDHGIGASNELHLLLLKAGECLVDEIEVSAGGSGNLVGNSSFEFGTNGWVIQGNHIRSGLAAEGANGNSSLHLRARGPGDTGANRVETDLISNPTGSNVTLRAKARWLRGQPTLLLRLYGNWLEAVGRLAFPANLGTPGQRNSRAMTNAGPALHSVSHSPVLPPAFTPVRVTVQVDDPDDIPGLRLRYRVDPATTFGLVDMSDDGTSGDERAGDRIFSGWIPGQRAGALVAFHIEATDGFSPPTTSRFPVDAPARECLVRFGETSTVGSIGDYHLWMTTNNIREWTARARFSDEPLDCTFVYGNQRVIYNAEVRYGGDRFLRSGFTSPLAGLSTYVVDFPADDTLFGGAELLLEPVDPNRDNTALREMTAFWMAEQLGLPGNHLRFVRLAVNGVREASRGVPVFLDRQWPNAHYVMSRFDENPDGELFEAEDWSEFSDGANPIPQSHVWATLEGFTTAGVTRQARYRWNWRKQFNNGLDDDYSKLFGLVDILRAPESTYVSHVGATISPEWMATMALRHAVGDWDGYGYSNGRNAFLYRDDPGVWHLLFGRLSYALGASGGDSPTQNPFQTSDPTMTRLLNQPQFRRDYLQALERLANGPMQASQILSFLNTRYQALVTNGIAVSAPTAISAWLTQRRTHLLAQLPSVPWQTPQVSIENGWMRISGLAPLSLSRIEIAGGGFGAPFLPPYPLFWSSPTNWSVTIPWTNSSTQLRIVPYDIAFRSLTNWSLTLSNISIYSHPVGAAVINEIMYHPASPNAGFVEIHNLAPMDVDLSLWGITELDFRFPLGTVLPALGFVVIAEDRTAFVASYGMGVPIAGELDRRLNPAGGSLSLLYPGPDFFLTAGGMMDRVKYESNPPWPPHSSGTGASLQLIDPYQDNSRVGNWSTHYVPGAYSPGTNFPGATNATWRRVIFTGLMQGPPSTSATNLLFFLSAPGDVYLDDVVLVPGNDPEAGTNELQNGDFEEPLSTGWHATGNHSNSMISTSISHSGVGSLRLSSSGFGGVSGSVTQVLPGPNTNNTPYTLSYWFLATGSNVLTVRTIPGSSFRNITKIEPEILPPFSIPPTVIRPESLGATPGTRNTHATNLEAIQPLWLNELQSSNTTGILDNMSELEPWIELYNSGGAALPLDGFYLTDTYTDLTQWAFPAGTTIGPNEFLLVWADGEPNETAGTNLHTGFRLNGSTGSLALVRVSNNRTSVLDYVNYAAVHEGFSYGSYPNGQLLDRFALNPATPGHSNLPPPVQVFINEWVASNTTLADPADGDLEDWFELYNAQSSPVDLSGYWLSDSLLPRTAIPKGTIIAAKGFLLVWADNETEQNAPERLDLHVDFALSRSGDDIVLLAPDGWRIIDKVDFEDQFTDVSQGRSPDGAGRIRTMSFPTPRGPNVIPNLNAPVIAEISNRTAMAGRLMQWVVDATDSESPPWGLTFILEPGAPTGASIGTASGIFTWTPAVEQAPSTNTIGVRVTDNGVPPLSAVRTFTVTVYSPPRVTALDFLPEGQLSLNWQTVPGKSYRVEYKDDLNAPEWSSASPAMAATGKSLSFTNSLGAGPQRFFRIVLAE